MNMFYIG